MWEGWEGRTRCPRVAGYRSPSWREACALSTLSTPAAATRSLPVGRVGRASAPSPTHRTGPQRACRARGRAFHAFHRIPPPFLPHCPAAEQARSPTPPQPLRRRQPAEKQNGRKLNGFAASPHDPRPSVYPLAFSWRVHRENWPEVGVPVPARHPLFRGPGATGFSQQLAGGPAPGLSLPDRRRALQAVTRGRALPANTASSVPGCEPVALAR